MKYKFVICGEEMFETDIDNFFEMLEVKVALANLHCNGQMGLVQAVPVENFPSTPESVPAGVAFGAN